MENVVLTAADFNGRLNKEFFTNITKGITPEEFNKRYPTSEFHHCTKSEVMNFIEKAYELTGGDIQKGSFNDTEECIGILNQMREQVSLMKAAKVEVNGEIIDKFALRKSTQPIEKAKNDDNAIVKGSIYDLISYGSTFIEFDKKGAELKQKLAIKKSEITQACIEIKSKLLEIEKSLSHVPTEPIDGIEFSKFHYELCYNEGHNVNFNESDSGMLTAQEAEINRNWNDNCYKYSDLNRELKAIELLERELVDNKSYKLTASQMLNFGF